MTADQRALDQGRRDAHRLDLLRAAFDADLTTNAKIVLVAMVTCAPHPSKMAAPADAIMKLTGLSRAAVFKELSNLEAGGHITRSSRWRKSAIYKMHPSNPPHGVHQVESTTETP